MPSIPIDVLRAFVAVVESRGFTRAAEERGRSQPTVSLQVKRLERLVEAPLFEKDDRFDLTSVGAVCFEYGKRLLRLHDDIFEEAQRRASPGATLRIGSPSELAAHFAARLGGLRDAVRPGAGIEVMTGASEQLLAAFKQKALDIAFVIDREGEADGAPRTQTQVQRRLRERGQRGACRSRSRRLGGDAVDPGPRAGRNRAVPRRGRAAAPVSRSFAARPIQGDSRGGTSLGGRGVRNALSRLFKVASHFVAICHPMQPAALACSLCVPTQVNNWGCKWATEKNRRQSFGHS